MENISGIASALANNEKSLRKRASYSTLFTRFSELYV